MPGPTLLQRIAAASDRPAPARQGPSEHETVLSIVRNLRALLGSRVGASMARPDWGLVDFIDWTHNLAQTAAQIAIQIERKIARFEPRLRDVRVMPEPASDAQFSLCFRIEARLTQGRPTHVLSLLTRLGADGSIRIEP